MDVVRQSQTLIRADVGTNDIDIKHLRPAKTDIYTVIDMSSSCMWSLIA